MATLTAEPSGMPACILLPYLCDQVTVRTAHRTGSAVVSDSPNVWPIQRFSLVLSANTHPSAKAETLITETEANSFACSRPARA